MATFFIPTVREAESVFGPGELFNRRGLQYFAGVKHTVVVTGVGKTNAAIALTRFISGGSESDGDLALIGIAGAYKESGVKVGDLLAVKTDYFADEALLTDSALIGIDELGFPINEGNRCEFVTPFELPVCSANTVSLLSGTDYLARLYWNKTRAAIESMEGAAFALAAASFEVKTAQVRAASNYCGARDKQEWDVKKALTALRRFVNSL